jgi:hypothetical protein
MIDPTKITSFNLSQSELEEVLLFWVCAAGKNGTTAARTLENLLVSWHIPGESPFSVVRLIAEKTNLAEEMRKAGIGCFNNKAKTFIALATSDLDLKTCTVDDLEAIPGIGPKSARCFLMHSRPNQSYAGLDRHILNYMSDCGILTSKNTPTGKKYKDLEQQFLRLAKMSKKSVADLDLLIWKVYSGRNPDKGAIIFLDKLKYKWKTANDQSEGALGSAIRSA